MIPIVYLIQPPIITPYLPPDELTQTALEDWEEGGIGISDGSGGLQYQVWHMIVLGEGIGTGIWIDAPNTLPTLIFSYPNITWARLAFDQNMHPFIAFMSGTQSIYYWWDPLTHNFEFVNLASNIQYPCVTMDEKDSVATLNNTNDIILCYFVVTGTYTKNLCFRRQRDRYGIEYTWATGLDYTNYKNVVLNKIGMEEGKRLRINITATVGDGM